MKIIQLIQKPQRRGAEIFAAQLSEQLKLTGNEVLLISIFEGESDLPFYGKWIRLNRPIGYRFFDFKGWKQFSRIVKDFNPDIIQANAADTLKFSIFSKRLFKWKNPLIYRNANQMGDFIRNGFHKSFNQWLLNQVAGIVSVSKASAENLHNTFCYPLTKSIVIPIGIDLNEIDLKQKEKTLINLPENFLLQIGGLVPEKDPLGMLAIFSRISATHQDLHLVFLGSGILREKLVEKVEELDIESKVIMIPALENIFPILNKATALVLPSKIEGLPGVILEAMYCKVPVIAYDVGGIGEVVNKYRGWLVYSGDSKCFENELNHLIHTTDSERCALLSTSSQFIEEHYSISKISTQFEAYFNQL
ncbi:glycosyltransferase family 4 protein [uncultured Algoriphagus sp.]|uniref:glycosyltransferase family 4 protein n=1 Tax=uncultured Algoriphagus sp. TaxID=417365 RepID=UPI0030EC58C0|tara:strand:+ start:102315 stop:103400 length:1086 start_codon:yes stop_codon:yes gene_type:complete